MSDYELKHGIYESIITGALEKRLHELPANYSVKKDTLDTAESAFVLALHLTKLLAGTLASFKGEDKTSQQAKLCNQILGIISQHNPVILSDQERIAEDLMYLLAIQDPARKTLNRPDTPLANAALFTGTASDLTLESELKKEIQTADRIDFLCSFIKWSGLRLLLPFLQEANADHKEIRIITTSYMGATDLKAIEELRKLSHVHLRVSYDTKRTRLHAKSYIFHRDNGFGTAYIGSSNLSNPALTSGLEWNLKISQYESPYLWEKICATFETYQNHPEFERYDEHSIEKLAKALKLESGSSQSISSTQALLDISPYPYQEEILDKLRAERELHQHNKNLIVAATGTGKTILAAFDFLRIRANLPNCKFLFVAHREEILTQSLLAFRQVLRDQNFAELFVGNYRPESYDHLFVSIQSLNSNKLWEILPASYYDYIVVDEFHHAAAAGYQRLLEHFKPAYLLGLTATPERHDGLDILKYFDQRIAAEIRLPDAINKKLLAPFQYFGITDCVDLQNLKWAKGAYDKYELGNLLSGNAKRASLVLQKMQELLLDINKCRCLCFCVSQNHAEFMSRFLNEHSVKAAALTAETSDKERFAVQTKLQQRDLNVVCVVDLYNEGIDIPSVDTVLFLRPTESLTVFLQQLGRGLRTYKEWDKDLQDYSYKECLTVLDFVGNAHQNFNFEQRFRAFLGSSNLNVADEIERGFPHLPKGCHIQLEKMAQTYILKNIKNSIACGRRNMLISRIAAFEMESGLPLSLKNFIDFHHLELSTIYQYDLFSRLCVKAQQAEDFILTDEDRFRKGLLRITHMNSPLQLKTLLDLLQDTPERLKYLNEEEMHLLNMLHFCIWTRKSEIHSLQESIATMRSNEVFFAELLEVLSFRLEQTDLVTRKPQLPFPCFLELHASYTRDEILAGLGWWTPGKAPLMRTGVQYLPEINTDIFLITLNKSEKHYSPTTMYLDYAISETLFHWQSQSTTSINSSTGQRYLKGNSTILLFVRENKNSRGLSESYCFLGPAVYSSHSGSAPINIQWRLLHKMPARLCRMTERLAIA